MACFHTNEDDGGGIGGLKFVGQTHIIGHGDTGVVPRIRAHVLKEEGRG